MRKTYQHYRVAADRTTGEWLCDPQHMGEVGAFRVLQNSR